MLAYSGLTDLIFTNRAKESAQTMRIFIERALAESKRKQTPVTISIAGNNIRYTGDGGATYINEHLSDGFASIVKNNEEAVNLSIPTECAKAYPAEGIEFKSRIGISGATEGCFAVCGAKGYCGAAVKTDENNSFTAWIKRGSSARWEEL